MKRLFSLIFLLSAGCGAGLVSGCAGANVSGVYVDYSQGTVQVGFDLVRDGVVIATLEGKFALASGTPETQSGGVESIDDDLVWGTMYCDGSQIWFQEDGKLEREKVEGTCSGRWQISGVFKRAKPE